MQSFNERSRDLLAEAEGLFEEVIANAIHKKEEQQKAGPQTGQKRDRSSITSKTVSTSFPHMSRAAVHGSLLRLRAAGPHLSKLATVCYRGLPCKQRVRRAGTIISLLKERAAVLGKRMKRREAQGTEG